MSTFTRSLIGAHLVGHVEGLLKYGQIDEIGRATAQQLVNAWRAELARDLGHDRQDNVSVADLDSRLAEEVEAVLTVPA